jgi:hypothetical protein
MNPYTVVPVKKLHFVLIVLGIVTSISLCLVV